ncbi:uncharacterized protein [Palaemon carinicauda]|uniref:uncharacterized protein n=1 Tax=Palaemon carinicauda TaxID=392227 RepID=UPI0035B57C8C
MAQMRKSNEDLEEFPITSQDADDIYNLTRVSYVNREPLCLGLHMSFEEFLPLLKEVFPPTFDSQVSFGMREKSSGRLVAFMLSRILHPDAPDIFQEGGQENEKANQYTKVLHDLCRDVDVFNKGRFKKQLELQCLNVHPDYNKRGLAFKLIQMSEEKGRDLGCDVATIQAVNVVTDHIAEKMGYSTIKKTDVKTLTDATGRLLLDVEAVTEKAGTSHFNYFVKAL